jgi:hypothetical protein
VNNRTTNHPGEPKRREYGTKDYKAMLQQRTERKRERQAIVIARQQANKPNGPKTVGSA